MTTPPYNDDEPITRAAGLARPQLRSVSDPPDESDEAHRLGLIMAAVTKLRTDVDALKTLPSEVRSLRDEIAHDRDALVHGASHSAAKHSSNRMAALMGALFTLYELSAPVLHEIARWFHK